MIILVCGSRDWTCLEDVGVHIPHPGDPDYGPHIYIHGGARGADTLVDIVAKDFGHTVIPYPVNTALDGRWPQAGPRRNTRMLRDGKPDRGLAFGPLYEPAYTPAPIHGTRALNAELEAVVSKTMRRTGTGDMVAKMLRAGLTVRWVPYPGAPVLDLTAMPPPA